MDGATIDLGAIAQFAREVGGNALLLLGLLAVVSGRLVPKPFVDEIRKDRDEWKQVARGGVQQAAESVRAQTRTVSVAEEAARIAAEVVRQQVVGGQGPSPP